MNQRTKLTASEQQEIGALAARLGTARAARELGVERTSLAALMVGGARRGTVVLAIGALDRLRAAQDADVGGEAQGDAA